MPEETREQVRLRELIQGGFGIMPPLILWPGAGQPIGELAGTSGGCGPKKVTATEKGEWDSQRRAARASARAEARAAAEETCRGGCESGVCKYLETEGTITGPEERENPQNPHERQFRYEYTSTGTCQCE